MKYISQRWVDKFMKIGLVYYSRTGNTKQVAKTLEDKLKVKADVELIEIEHVKKPGFFTFSISLVLWKWNDFPFSSV